MTVYWIVIINEGLLDFYYHAHTEVMNRTQLYNEQMVYYYVYVIILDYSSALDFKI